MLDVAARAGADALHPGYGFLSENADFARACLAVDITFIGPRPDAIEHLGSKTNARELAGRAEVPVMPGTTRGVSSSEEAAEIADRIGYPVLLKAAAGGGGKGMRVVENADGLATGLRAAQGEAMTAFGDDEVFVEKYVINPRHIEIQIIRDASGRTLVLGERECSIQRRHQKVIEEAPSVAIDDDLRTRMYEAALRLVDAADYTNAGTLEFLLDGDGNFYFLEVNTRLQVEHTVSEMVTGLDLVSLQLRVARGEELPIEQSDIEVSGHAIECRICAEDSFDRFLPSIGRIDDLIEPSGDGIRVDSGLYPGMEVSLYYDPMVAKLIVHGATRTEAIDRMLAALDQYHIAGVRTTIPFCRAVLQHPAFVSGEFSTGFVREHWTNPQHPVDDEKFEAAAAAALSVHEERSERKRSALG